MTYSRGLPHPSPHGLSNRAMSGTWSQRIERHYHLQLTEDVRAWLDQRVWAEPGGAEFCRPQTPERILDPEPGTIWAGFMLPDTLPVVGNDYGDWLCLRVAGDGSIGEVIHWSHCGGDWIPFGQNLAEALLYDAWQRVVHPERIQMVESALPPADVFRLARWARGWCPGAAAPILPFWELDTPLDADMRHAVLNSFHDSQVAEFALRRDRVLQHLESPLKVASEPELARSVGVDWEPDFVKWVFDTQAVPAAHRARLQQQLHSDGQLFQQDWPSAEQEALAVIQRRRDLGWAFDVAGWAAQRRGDSAAAVELYRAGIQTSWFSDDTVRFRTHWFEEGYGKFAAAQLAGLSDQLTDQQRQDPYLRIFLDNDPTTLRARVHQYWLEQAQQAEQRGEFRRAYQCFYRAGWDLGLQPITGYEAIFDGLARTARRRAHPCSGRSRAAASTIPGKR